MPLLQEATATTGTAYYLLTGTNNFAQILDDMIDDGLIAST